MRTIDSINESRTIEDKALSILDERKEDISKILISRKAIDDKESSLNELKEDLREFLDTFKESIGLEVYEFLEVEPKESVKTESVKGVKPITKEGALGNLYYEITKDFLNGERDLTKLAVKYYTNVEHPKNSPKAGTLRVIEGIPDKETVKLVGRQIDDNEKKGLLILKNRSGSKNGKVYIPIIREITEAGRKVYGDIKIISEGE